MFSISEADYNQARAVRSLSCSCGPPAWVYAESGHVSDKILIVLPWRRRHLLSSRRDDLTPLPQPPEIMLRWSRRALGIKQASASSKPRRRLWDMWLDIADECVLQRGQTSPA